MKRFCMRLDNSFPPLSLLLGVRLHHLLNFAQLSNLLVKSCPSSATVCSMEFELIGRPDKLDAFLKMFEGYNILELCRTGVTALERGGMHQHIQKPPQEVRSVQLPPPGARRA